MTVYALLWDDSDPDVPESKLRRAIYASADEAIAQATHDLLCLRCRVYENGKPTLASTGIEPLDSRGKDRCRDCGGTRVCPSRSIVAVEKLSKVEREELNRGEIVWEPTALDVG